MRGRLSTRWCTLFCAAAILLPAATAQTQSGSHTHHAHSSADSKPNHKHYEKPEGYGQPGPGGRIAPRLINLGKHAFPVTTRNSEAQVYINQGVNLAYGFNHLEAARAFMEAARLDPECAMAYWGHAYVLGANINAPMNPDDEAKALELVRKAQSLKTRATPREQAYIDAIAQRYSGKAEERAERERAYANAMREVHKRFPDDLDAASLFAESVMNLSPWNYWTRDGVPYPETVEAVSAIEAVLKRNPDHPGAIHFYIHLMEPTDKAHLAEAGADRLGKLVPGAGHLVHMPGHIYLRVGRYADAVQANLDAIAADEDYITQCRVQGIYPLVYYPHNVHFLWAAAHFDGRSAMAIDAANKTAAQIPPEALKDISFLDAFMVLPYYAKTRFGKWDEALAEPKPKVETPMLMGIWHHMRGMALANKGRVAEAEQELAALRGIVSRPDVAQIKLFSNNYLKVVLDIGAEVLAGEIAGVRGQHEQAISHLSRGVRLEDSLIYTEPPDWYAPVRQYLGAALLKAGRPLEAEVVYWEDLTKFPENGWALYGLAQAQKAQGKHEEVKFTEARFKKAWARADIVLSASRF